MLDKTRTIEKFKLDGRIISAELNFHAHYAESSVILRESKNAVLAALVTQPLENPFQTSLLSVDYRERMYAGNRIPGNYFRRELRPSEREVLIAKTIERCLRPALPNLSGYRAILYVNVLSASPSGDLPSLGLLAASIALNLSSLPLKYRPLAVRSAQLSGQNFTLFLPFNREEEPALDLFVSLDGETILAIDGKADSSSDEQILQAVNFAKEQLTPLREFIQKHGGKNPTAALPHLPPELLKAMSDKFSDKIIEILKSNVPSPERHRLLRELKKEAKVLLSSSQENNSPEELGGGAELSEREESAELSDHPVGEESPEEFALSDGTNIDTAVDQSFQYIYKAAIREELAGGRRPDGRELSQLRPLEFSIGVLPSSDGSALCERGETQVLASVTLGSQRDAQSYETIFGSATNHYIFHHNSLPLAFGNINTSWTPGFRELDLGYFIRKALLSSLPPLKRKTIRGVTELLSSAGAISTTALTAISLALLEAGVPLRYPVVGLSLSTVKTGEEGDETGVKIISDPLSEEELASDGVGHFAASSEGFTAIQYYTLDRGLELSELEEFLSAARKALDSTLEKLKPTTDPLWEKNLQEEKKFDAPDEPVQERGTQVREARSSRYYREEKGSYSQQRRQQRPLQRTEKKAESKISEVKIEVDPALLGKIIGVRGQHVQALRQLFNVKITADESGEITVSGYSPEDVARTTRQLKALIESLEQNKPYLAAVIESSESQIKVRVGEHEGVIPYEEMLPDAKRPFRGQELLVVPIGIDREGHLLFSAKQAQKYSPDEAVNFEKIEI